MKLGNSQSSGNGSQLSQIVDFTHPEERMAARLIERLGISPPIDVVSICQSFADLAYKTFPIEIDGVCLDLKQSGKRPKVWVSKSMPRVRQRFTIAHEIGHIVIPWHRGSIVDDLDAPRSRETSKYREMEAEANRFAAELLMPSAWVIGLAERANDLAALMHSIREIADISYPAAFLKAAKHGSPGYIGSEVKNGLIVRSVRTPETSARAPTAGSAVTSLDMPAADDPRIVYGPDSDYYWWEIRNSVRPHTSELPPWREILNEILEEIPPEFRPKTRSSVNAIIGAAIGKEPKGSEVGRIFRRGLESAQNRESNDIWVQHTIEHERFRDYILARAQERSDS